MCSRMQIFLVQCNRAQMIFEGKTDITAASCRFNGDTCSNCDALSRYVDDAGRLTITFVALCRLSSCHQEASPPFVLRVLTAISAESPDRLSGPFAVGHGF